MNGSANRLWLNHYPSSIPKCIAYEKKPLHAFLKECAFQTPKLKALHFMGGEMNFQKLYDEAKKLAAYLQSLGIKKGDRVSIMLPNTPQAVISYYATLIAGGIVVQTNPLYKERELEYQLQDSESRLIICLDILLPIVSKARQNTAVEHTIITRIKDYLPYPQKLVYPFIQKKQDHANPTLEQADQVHLWSKVMLGNFKVKDVAIDPMEDLALLQYTGGTTGFPKGVMLSHYNLVSNVVMCKAWIHKEKNKQDIVLGVLPFFHVYGMTTVMNYSLLTGSKMVLLPRFEVDAVLKTIKKQKVTVFPGAPTIYIGILNHPKLKKYDLSSIEVSISGSAPLPTEVQVQFEKVTGGRLIEGYGLTESSPVTHANFLEQNRIQGGIGVPWPDTDAKIISLETQEEANIGEPGEIVIRGPQVMKGYWNKPEETEQALKEGWLYTGDVGYMDDQGCFYVIDRKKDMIIASGYNIYPREVEEVLYEHEGVQEVVVLGIPDPYRGETVKAFIVPKEDFLLEEHTLDNFCRKYLASYKVPRVYEIRKELPKTAVGKILRRKLVEEERKKDIQTTIKPYI